jgi:hypothetical protein
MVSTTCKEVLNVEMVLFPFSYLEFFELFSQSGWHLLKRISLIVLKITGRKHEQVVKGYHYFKGIIILGNADSNSKSQLKRLHMSKD